MSTIPFTHGHTLPAHGHCPHCQQLRAAVIGMAQFGSAVWPLWQCADCAYEWAGTGNPPLGGEDRITHALEMQAWLHGVITARFPHPTAP